MAFQPPHVVHRHDAGCGGTGKHYCVKPVVLDETTTHVVQRTSAMYRSILLLAVFPSLVAAEEQSDLHDRVARDAQAAWSKYFNLCSHVQGTVRATKVDNKTGESLLEEGPGSFKINGLSAVHTYERALPRSMRAAGCAVGEISLHLGLVLPYVEYPVRRSLDLQQQSLHQRRSGDVAPGHDRCPARGNSQVRRSDHGAGIRKTRQPT
jgi:hypothetical protein